MSGILRDAVLFEIDPEEVEIGDRTGFYHADFAAGIGRLIAIFGQRDPIKVRKNPKPGKPWLLVVGRHRLVGCQMEKVNVWAIEVKGKPEDFKNLEASENVERRVLNPIERAMFVHTLCEAARDRIAREHGDLKPQQLAIRARWARVKAGEVRADQALRDEVDDTTDKMSVVYQWNEAAADALGMTKRTVERSLRLYRLVVQPFPELAEPLSKHPVVGKNEKQLRDIADLGDERIRRRVIETLIADPEIGVDDAMVMLGERTSESAQPAYLKQVDAVTGNLGKLSATLQKRHLRDFVRALKGGEVKRQLRDMLDEELSNGAA